MNIHTHSYHQTSLIFSIASELNCNVAFINFHRELDDTGLMQAITEIPDNCILVFEDIDALFKERKDEFTKGQSMEKRKCKIGWDEKGN